MGCFLFGLPLGVISIMCYGIYTADTDGGYIEERYEVSKSELESQEQAEESTEPEPSLGDSLAPIAQEPKDVLEKKKDWETLQVKNIWKDFKSLKSLFIEYKDLIMIFTEENMLFVFR